MEPKLLPLVEEIGARFQSLTVDSKLVNCLVEKGQQQGEVFVYKRPAMALVKQLPAGVARGLFQWQASYYAIVDGGLYKNGTLIGAVQNAGTYTWTSTLGATPKLFLQNGTVAYTVTTGGVVTQVTDINYPAAVVPGAVYLDGTGYVMDANGNIFGSTATANDMTTWDPLNLIKAQIEPTSGVYLAKQLVFVFALKQNYSEAFYDAGNASGSPLGPVAGAKLNYGCVDAGTVRDVGGDLMWLANTGEGFPCVVRVSSLKAEVVSTPNVERLLATSVGPFYSWNCRVEGHRLYGITATDQNFTLVYDLTVERWYQWTDQNGNYLPYKFSCQGANNTIFFLHESNGKICSLDVGTFKDDGELPFVVDIRTPNYDGGSRISKTLHAIYFLADQQVTTLAFQYTDDDYQSFTTLQSVDLSVDRPSVVDLGSFTKRAFRFIHQDNTSFRIKGVELFTSFGTMP